MDQRLRCAVDANVGWYEDILASHGIDSMLESGLWSSLDRPPPLHSDAVVVEPAVTGDQILARLHDRPEAAVKDSFSRVDLSTAGWSLLFNATWMYRAGGSSGAASAPGWGPVRSAEELSVWNEHNDTTGVVLPALLRRAHFRVLARYVDEEMVGGAVARLSGGVVDVSNVHARAGHELDWAGLVQAAGRSFPDRPLVGYARGDSLQLALQTGFVPTGDLRVWVRHPARGRLRPGTPRGPDAGSVRASCASNGSATSPRSASPGGARRPRAPRSTA